MLNRQQLKEYRQLRRLSTRDVAYYCELSQPMITQIETGVRPLTEYNYKQFVDGVNNAYYAIRNKTFKKAPRINKPKEEMNKPIVLKNTKPKNKGGRPPKNKDGEKK